MSDNYLRLLPTDPGFVPSPAAASAALAALASIAPECDDLRIVEEQEVTFVDAGSNFSAVRCPACGAELAIVPWWQGEMDRTYRTGFEDLTLVTPCCRTPMSLNDLDYEWPQGFARWWLEARNPRRSRLEGDERAVVASVVGSSLREVWTHI